MFRVGVVGLQDKWVQDEWGTDREVKHEVDLDWDRHETVSCRNTHDL